MSVEVVRDESVQVAWRSWKKLSYAVNYRPSAVTLIPNDNGEARRVEIDIGVDCLFTAEEWQEAFAALETAARDVDVVLGRGSLTLRNRRFGGVLVTLTTYQGTSEVVCSLRKLRQAVEGLIDVSEGDQDGEQRS